MALARIRHRHGVSGIDFSTYRSNLASIYEFKNRFACHIVQVLGRRVASFCLFTLLPDSSHSPSPPSRLHHSQPIGKIHKRQNTCLWSVRIVLSLKLRPNQPRNGRERTDRISVRISAMCNKAANAFRSFHGRGENLIHKWNVIL